MANKFDIWVILGFKDKASAPMKKAGKSVENVSKTFLKLSAAAVAAAVAMKKVYDIGKQGAAIAQTTESFNRLGVSIEDLRTASRGTIDDMTLMSASLTLVAGAGEELQKNLLTSAPQLLAIAKAANKLNPTLGDTAFMYDSIATGIKRSSPLILDNLGIVVKVGQANEEYAVAIGKTVAQLTAEDKQMALLNATIKAGDRLIEQVGGSTEALGDSYAELETNLKNITDQFKTNISDGVTPLVKGYADLLSATIAAREEHGYFIGTLVGLMDAAKEVSDSAPNWTDWMGTEEIEASLTGGMYQEAKEAIEGIGQAADVAAPPVQAVASAVANHQKALAGVDTAMMLDYTQYLQDAADAAANLQVATDNATASLEGMAIATFISVQMEALAAQTGDAALSAQELADANRALLIEFGLLTESEQYAQEQINNLNASFQSGAIDLETYTSRLRGIKSGIDNLPNYKKILIEIEERRTISTRYASQGFDETINPDAPSRAGGFNGVVSQPTFFRVGESGPERVTIEPTTNHNYNMTVNTAAGSDTYGQDFFMMQAMAQ